ncbi:alpha-amylase family glycosyl hydrolase [Niveispirillum sp. KHB5.9]|uniref:alpha-amylase family glycosyl hydrolase n=1 Tax=Niveispirillum sp. KHB5.9 TaxID=3400269 RepID=UPI003A838B64
MPRLLTKAATLLALAAPAYGQTANPDRPFADDVVYFVVTDRMANGDPASDKGGLTGGPEQTGYDPTDIGMFHGGDFQGLTAKLDYIQGLGVTAIWVTPPVTNKVVHKYDGGLSAGYHGYWGVDFLNVDPHLGGNAAFKAFVEAAHARGMKVIMDIVVNHTGDVIQYRECDGTSMAKPCPYRSKGDYPTTRNGLNPGFQGDRPAAQTNPNYATLTDINYAYTPYVPAGQEQAKNPAWMNDPRHYHNRGDSTFSGEDSIFGDFARLDDLYTEQPAVVDGLIDIYKHWVREYRIDGFRLDTAKHVNPEFWHRFVPEVTAFAKAQGIPNFIIFGEVANDDVSDLAAYTGILGLPSVLDFALSAATLDTLGKGKDLDEWDRLFRGDRLYPGGPDAARDLATFISNHDQGRLAFKLRKANPKMTADELQARVALGHALMFFSRGVPVLYYGDEQGFVGLGDDKASRQPMFASASKQFNTEERLGTIGPRTGDAYQPNHALYRAFTEMAAIRQAHPGLRQGKTVVRYFERKGPGLLAFSRVDEGRGEQFLVVANTDTKPRSVSIDVDGPGTQWSALRGACGAGQGQSYTVTVPALDYVVCRRG